jgi:RNA polymerase sigma-70 factor, ECF subfamily
LYGHYLPRVLAYISYRVGREQDAEDLTAETLLRVVDKWDAFRYQGEGSFAAWLFRIAHNLTSNFYRDNRKRNVHISLEVLPEIQDSNLLPSDAILKKEMFAELHKLVNALPPRPQEVITLRFFGNLRNRDIANILALDERTVSASS